MRVERIRRFTGFFAIVFASSCAGRKFETAPGASETPDGGHGAESPGGSGGTPSAGGVIGSTGAMFGTGGAPSTGGAATIDTGGAPTSTGGASTSTGGASTNTGGASTNTGGASVTGGAPSTGGLASNTGGTAPGTGGASTGGAPSCQNGVDCGYCCNQQVPSSSTSTGSEVFSLALYGCGCSTCYGVCDSSLCNSQVPLPSLNCLSCIHANVGTGECKSEWDQCQTDSVCGRFGSCVFACL
jgi:hypothetical protein